MSELKYDDSSDDDVFIVREVKSVSKKITKQITLQQAVGLQGTLKKAIPPSKNKKKEEKKLNSKQNHKKRNENLSTVSKSLSAEFLKSKGRKKTESSCVSKNHEVSENQVNEYKSHLSEKEIEVICNSEEIKLLENITVNSISQHSSKIINMESHDVNKEQNNVEENSRKRVSFSPEKVENRKKVKNTVQTVSSMELNDSNLADCSNELPDPNSLIIKNSELELLLNISVDDFIKSEIKFEESLSTKLEEFDQYSSKNLQEELRNNGKLLCFLFKKIIGDEIRKQIELKQTILVNGTVLPKLFHEMEYNVFQKFFNLQEKASVLFVRMLLRKRSWHRISSITYTDIGNDLEKHFQVLSGVNFVDINIEDDDLEVQLNLLSRPEIVKLCKTFNVSCKSPGSVKKEVLIQLLIEQCRKQKSVMDVIKGAKLNHRTELLKSEIKKCLGKCIKINRNAFKAFYKVLILFSFPHYFDEEDKRFTNELFMYINVYRNLIQFPNYKLSPTVVFETLHDLDEYQTSLSLLNNFEVAVDNKNHSEFMCTVNEVKKGFQNILSNTEYQERFLRLPSFLKKFSAGAVYARILTKYCQTFKRQADELDIIYTVKLLLNQKLFLQGKRGDWYEILSKALEHKRENHEAAEVLITALKDSSISEVQHFNLQLRGQAILKKKSYGISDTVLKEKLAELCIISVQEPISIEIKGKALESNEFGLKCVYVHDTGHGKKYLSVEERALLYYKSHGFTKGYHVEGYIVQSIYFLFFFDIIYGYSPKGVFQSPYQNIPLDFNSTSFYLNRKHEIDKLLTEMVTWDDMKVETVIKDVYSRNCDTTCVIAWNDEFTPELFCEIIKCITMPVMVLIFQRLVQNFRVYRSGFPDLTLWNPATKEVKFVEVKSPNDKLSPAQRVWLNYLTHIGLSAEVCNVKNMSGKNLD